MYEAKMNTRNNKEKYREEIEKERKGKENNDEEGNGKIYQTRNRGESRNEKGKKKMKRKGMAEVRKNTK